MNGWAYRSAQVDGSSVLTSRMENETCLIGSRVVFKHFPSDRVAPAEEMREIPTDQNGTSLWQTPPRQSRIFVGHDLHNTFLFVCLLFFSKHNGEILPHASAAISHVSLYHVFEREQGHIT